MAENGAQVSAVDLIQIVQLFQLHKIVFHIDGSWAVDALLGAQSQVHSDLDIAVPSVDLAPLKMSLAAQGYKLWQRAQDSDYQFVMLNSHGVQIDVRAHHFDQYGKSVKGVAYPAEALSGEGQILGQSVPCIRADWLVRFRSQYAAAERAEHDVKRLRERFGLTNEIR